MLDLDRGIPSCRVIRRSAPMLCAHVRERSRFLFERPPALNKFFFWPYLTSLTSTRTDGLRRYEIIRRLGEGGFGVVHLVREKATGEEWAAKVLHATDDASKADGMSREDIRNECEILKMMHHPSICRLREHFERDKGAEVVMVLELLSGGDLLDSVIDNGTYNEADAREIFTQVLDGVAHMHERGVVHRDLKVENLMMKNPGDLTSVKIIDVGLAIKVIDGENKEKKIREVSEEDMIKGTPEYMVRLQVPALTAAPTTRITYHTASSS